MLNLLRNLYINAAIIRRKRKTSDKTRGKEWKMNMKIKNNWKKKR